MTTQEKEYQEQLKQAIIKLLAEVNQHIKNCPHAVEAVNFANKVLSGGK